MLKTENKSQQQGKTSSAMKNNAVSEHASLRREIEGARNGLRFSFDKININSVRPAPARIQPKLMINQPGDNYEQEADATADKIMGMQEPVIGQINSATTSIQRKCDHCEEEEEKEGKIQRKEIRPGEAHASNDLSTYVNNLSNAGSPLPHSTRNFFEPRFGFDFSKVRIHTDAAASDSAKSINAHAYTFANN